MAIKIPEDLQYLKTACHDGLVTNAPIVMMLISYIESMQAVSRSVYLVVGTFTHAPMAIFKTRDLAEAWIKATDSKHITGCEVQEWRVSLPEDLPGLIKAQQ